MWLVTRGVLILHVCDTFSATCFCPKSISEVYFSHMIKLLPVSLSFQL